ncbi:MAG: hypothetical protein RMM29_04695 [Planctomycetota bacterium]|nr:hypothetical protein [Planctomycetota bacterium]MCX8039708.1 hypothetical protein [Planctomycetota bacterium]MDW8372934.1 hypothetical protein [Planctomycetota bacterium]
MPWTLWIAIAWLAALVQHSTLAALPLAPDLPLTLAAWAISLGEAGWWWRVWLVGVLRDLYDPGAEWFHTAALCLVIAVALPTQRWLPVMPWLRAALVALGAGALIAVLDLAASGGGRQAGSALASAMLSAALASLAAQWTPRRQRTHRVDEDQAAPSRPERSSGTTMPA